MNKIINVLVLTTTPDELRLIADLLDRKWAESKLGQEGEHHLVIATGIFDGEIHFRINQDAMHEEMRSRKEKMRKSVSPVREAR